MLSPDYERRSFSDLTADGKKIVGYAVVFNQPSQDLGGFVEVFEPPAVDRTLAERLDVRALVNHDPSQVLGRTTAGTLRLAKDARGLRVEIDPPDTTSGRDILASVARGDVTGMSLAFRVVQPRGERFEQRAGGLTRIISDAVILEASVVTFPAYEATDAQVARRALQAFQARQLGHRVDWLRRSLRVRA
jgi:HK97 family phage prohead protease